jgi:DNA-binding CsgD family transcriptional regulator
MRTSPRQHLILSLVADGYSAKEIGTRLDVSRRTVETHLQRLYARHGVRNRTALIAKWLRESEGDTGVPAPSAASFPTTGLDRDMKHEELQEDGRPHGGSVDEEVSHHVWQPRQNGGAGRIIR